MEGLIFGILRYLFGKTSLPWRFINFLQVRRITIRASENAAGVFISLLRRVYTISGILHCNRYTMKTRSHGDKLEDSYPKVAHRFGTASFHLLPNPRSIDQSFTDIIFFSKTFA